MVIAFFKLAYVDLYLHEVSWKYLNLSLIKLQSEHERGRSGLNRMSVR